MRYALSAIAGDNLSILLTPFSFTFYKIFPAGKTVISKQRPFSQLANLKGQMTFSRRDFYILSQTKSGIILPAIP